MPYARFLFLMAVATALGLFAWVYVIFQIDPYTSGWIGPVSFYVSLSMLCIGAFFLLGAGVHRLSSKEGPVLSRHVRGWLRRSILLTLGTIIPLMLASIDRFSFPIFFACVVVLLAVEALFLFVHQGRRV
jgi:TM2 domain-containing membrane protein YozV